MKKVITFLLTCCMLFNLTACGTVLYPERKGQAAGRLDPSIVILDAIGLLFYLVPGVIAFAVDFNNGAIYLPGRSATTLTNEEMERIARDGKVDMDALETLVELKTNQSIELDSSSLSVSNLNSVNQLPLALRAARLASVDM